MFAIQQDLFSIQPQKHKELRSYQKQAIKSVLESINKGENRIALILPTGAGKTFTVARLLLNLKSILPEYNPLALVPRRKLARQMKAEFRSSGIQPGIVKTVQSITDDKLNQGQFSGVNILILDECHETAWWQPVEKLLSINPNCIVIGLTATPDRLSKKEFFSDKFDKIIYPVTFGELVNDGYLCNPRYFSYGDEIEFQNVGIDADGGFIQEHLDKECEKKHFNETVVKNLLKHGVQSRRSIIFCASIRQSKQLAEMLNSANFKALHVDGKMSEKEQEQAIEAVATGQANALCCARLLIAGFDEPRIDTVVLATATTSRMNLVQMCGRGSRLHHEKDNEFWVFDFGDNFARLRVGLKQPFPYKMREDTEQGEAPVKVCPDCGELNYTFVMVCKECGHIFEPKPKRIQDLQDLDIVEVEADLVDLHHIKQIRRILKDCYSRDELPFIAIESYCIRNKVQSKHLFNPASTLGAIFKHKNLENVLDLTWYADKHIHRLSQKLFTKAEQKYLSDAPSKKLANANLEAWISFLKNLPAFEFGNYLRVKAVTKYIYKGNWYDVLGVMAIDTRETMEAAYKRRWRAINAEIERLTGVSQQGEFNPDQLAEILNNGNAEMKDLHKEIAVLQWAWRYVNLIYL